LQVIGCNLPIDHEPQQDGYGIRHLVSTGSPLSRSLVAGAEQLGRPDLREAKTVKGGAKFGAVHWHQNA
jgi:hypothetical protein